MSSMRTIENTMMAYLARHSVEAQPSGLDINHAALFDLITRSVSTLLGEADQGPVGGQQRLKL
ncbi:MULTISPECIES: hypothetical protein [Halomonadaceae]|uniref:hypothetical protein n=1 Tax=Halomonadaceae TaxID=28256 RepID=UPI003F93E250